MEALNFLKFWKPTIPFPTPVIEIGNDVVEEEEDSFFDLEITNSPKFSPPARNDTVSTNVVKTRTTVNYPKPSLSLSPIDPIPKRRVLPLEPPPKPQSPIALLKSAPNFRAFSFKKSKSTEKAKESPKPSKLVRANSSRRRDESAKPELVSKDVIQKYLRLVKPLYVKVSSRHHGGSAELFASSPSSSPAPEMMSSKDRNGIPAGIRVVCRQLGKSKSTTTSSLSSSNGALQTTSSSGRRDDSLLQHNDGIQSAILHCKQSFNSSRGKRKD